MAKKLLTLFLAILMAFSAVACGGGPTTSDGNIDSYETFDYSTGINKKGEKYYVVQNGERKYQIVYPSDPSATLLKQINLFNDYIYKITGTNLTAVADNGTPISGNYISVGNTSLATSAGVTTEGIVDDGFIIKTDANGNVYIQAVLERAFGYALNGFLEKFCGVRFLTMDMEVVPKSLDVVVQPCDILENANFKWRIWYGGGFAHKEFNAKMRYYQGEDEWCSDVNSVHNTTGSDSQPFIGYVNKADTDPQDSTKTLGVSHPEFFTDATNSNKGYCICPSNGIFYKQGADERDVDGDSTYSSGFESTLAWNNTTGIQPDGNVTVASYILAFMKRSLIKDKTQKINYFFIGKIDDRGAYCKCNDCNQRREEIKESGLWVILINALSNYLNEWIQLPQDKGGLGQEGRTISIATFAYQNTLTPPTKKNADGVEVPINDEVVGTDKFVIRIAPIDLNPTYSFYDEKQTDSVVEAMEGWDLCADHFMFWDYNCNYVEYFWYFPTTHFLKENLMYCKELGVFYAMLQSSYTQKGIWFDDMRNYIVSRLMWNFGWDVNYLINEYLTLYYGEAADIVKSVINQFENFYNQKRMEGTLKVRLFEPKGCFLNNDDNQNPKEWITGILRTVEDGITLIQNDPNLDESKKGDLVYKLEGVLITPMRMILRNYNSYYVEGKTDFAIKFFNLVEGRGITYLGETSIRSVATRKAECGL